MTAAELKQKLFLAHDLQGGRTLLRRSPATAQERAAALWSFGYFFMLLASTTCFGRCATRWASPAASRALPWLFTATFVTLLIAQPIYGALVARLPRARFIPIVYHFFVANLSCSGRC